jgi:hypothetical protein
MQRGSPVDFDKSLFIARFLGDEWVQLPLGFRGPLR